MYGIAISLLCVLISLNNVIHVSVKDLITNNQMQSDRKLNAFHYIALLIFLALLVMNAQADKLSLVASLICIVAGVITFIGVIRCVIQLLNYLVNNTVHKGAFSIALKNVFNNKYIRKNVSILALISMLLCIIGVLVHCSLQGMTSFYSDYSCQYQLLADKFTEEEISQVGDLQSVDTVYAFIGSALKMDNRVVTACAIEDPETYNESFLNLHLKWADGFDSKAFKAGDNVIITKILADKYDLTYYDKVELTEAETNIKKSYTIVGIANSLINVGETVYISTYNLQFETFKNKNIISINTTDEEKFISEINHEMTEKDMTISSIASKIERDKNNSVGIIAFFYVFVAIVSLISMLGVYSNFKMSYLVRQKEMAIQYSIGFSMNLTKRIIANEAMITAVVGCSLGGCCTFMLLNLLERFLLLMNLGIGLSMSNSVFIAILIYCALTTLLSVKLYSKRIEKIKDTVVMNIKM